MNHLLILRVAVPVVLLSLVPAADGRSAVRTGELSFADRVAAQRALEEVSYRHQLGAKRSFDAAVPVPLLEAKVRTYLKKSLALERYWSTPVTGAMLDAEIDRLARATRDPGRLAEMYAALGDDPLLVRECLARPLLVDRLTRTFFDHDASMQPDLSASGGEKRSWDSWWAEVAPYLDENLVRVAATDGRTLARPAAATVSHTCSPGNAWDNQSLDDPPDAREAHVAVWTGQEMIIWGGRDPSRRFTTGGIYSPSTDTWRSMNPVGAPPGNASFVADQAFWTGTEMLVWRGAASGGHAYQPLADSWRPIAITGAPVNPGVQAWIGNRLFVFDPIVPAAAAYDPAADSWTSLPTSGTPTSATQAFWTGTHVVTVAQDAVGRYNPASNAWLPVSTSGQASGFLLAAGSLGSEVLVVASSTARYDPDIDTWTPASLPPPGVLASASMSTRNVFTGQELLFWGGQTGATSYLTGPYRYDPATDAWSDSTALGGPSGRRGHSLVWTGTTMIAWGGRRRDPYFDTGGRYNPSTDSWTPVSTGNANKKGNHSAIWTGNDMIVWGGDNDFGASGSSNGYRYSPATDAWTSIVSPSFNVPGTGHTAVWSGGEMLVWGQVRTVTTMPAGGRYDPIADAWTSINITGSPAGVRSHTAVWTGDRMLVWGGQDIANGNVATGGSYDPATNAWTPLNPAGAPSARSTHAAVWTGSQMLIWGGTSNSGGRYDPSSDSWQPTSLTGAPVERQRPTAVWTGTEMIVRGGTAGSPGDNGGRYNPVTDFWSGIAAGDPGGNAAVWTGKVMLVWGGADPSGMGSEGLGGRYDPQSDAWSPLSIPGAPTTRGGHTAVWTGDRMIVWGGGDARTLVMRNGGVYVPDGNSQPAAAAQVAARVECTSPAGAMAILDGTASSDPDQVAGGDSEIASYEWIEGLGSGSPTVLGTGATLEVALPLGAHSIALKVTDVCGATSIANTTVHVEDTVAPTFVPAVDPSVLWPPDRSMRTVNVQGTVSDLCDSAASVALTGVTANEPAAGDVDGASVGTADFELQLRAERDQAGTGRVYRILYQANDSSGNAVERVVEVTVPHDRRGLNRSAAVRKEPVRPGITAVGSSRKP